MFIRYTTDHVIKREKNVLRKMHSCKSVKFPPARHKHSLKELNT